MANMDAAITPPMRAPARMAGRSTGSVTVRSVSHTPAPQACAASARLASMRENAA